MDCKEWLKHLKKWLEENWKMEDIEESGMKKLSGEETPVLKTSGEKLTIGRHPGEKYLRERPAIPEHLEEHAKSCSDCSKTLRGALMLIDGKKLRKSPRAELFYMVGKRILKEAEPRGLRISGWSIPRWVAVTTAAVLVFAVILIFTLLKPGNQETVMVHLSLEAPSASEVVVVGDWNGWDPMANRLTDTDGDGIWEIEIKLQRNREYRYQFVINGELWIPDPGAPLQIEDGFGGKDSILHI